MLNPIFKTIEVPCSQEKAFGVFVDEINSWWPLRTFSVSANAGEVTKSLRFEPRQGGEIVEVGCDDTEHLWGTVKSYDPYDSFSMDWHPGKPAESASLVEVRFTALGNERTRVELTQSNWEAVAEDKAGKFRASYGQGWVTIFEQAFKAACAG